MKEVEEYCKMYMHIDYCVYFSGVEFQYSNILHLTSKEKLRIKISNIIIFVVTYWSKSIIYTFISFDFKWIFKNFG